MTLAELLAKINEIKASLPTLEQAAKSDPASAIKLHNALNELINLQSEYTAQLAASKPLETDIEKRLEAVRQEEKGKLYGRLTQAEKEKEEQAKRLKELEATIADLAKAGAKPVEDPNKNTPTKKTPEELRIELDKELEIQRLKSEQALAAARAESQKQIDEINARMRKAELDAHRAKLIAAAGGKIIEEMVTGDTIEQLDTSALKARQSYERVYEAAAKTRAGVEEETRNNMPTIPTRVLDIQQLSEQVNETQIRNMTKEQWAEYRKKLGLK